MPRRDEAIVAGLFLAIAALPIGLILAAPVMRQPVAKPATIHTELVCHIDREQFPDGWYDVEKCNEEIIP